MILFFVTRCFFSFLFLLNTLLGCKNYKQMCRNERVCKINSSNATLRPPPSFSDMMMFPTNAASEVKSVLHQLQILLRIWGLFFFLLNTDVFLYWELNEFIFGEPPCGPMPCTSFCGGAPPGNECFLSSSSLFAICPADLCHRQCIW